METVADQAHVTRYKCCVGWLHLPGEVGCTYRKLVPRVRLQTLRLDRKMPVSRNRLAAIRSSSPHAGKRPNNSVKYGTSNGLATGIFRRIVYMYIGASGHRRR